MESPRRVAAVLLLLATGAAARPTATFTVVASAPTKTTVSAEFLGVTLDAASLWEGRPVVGALDVSSPALRSFLAELAPAVLRVGGGAADQLRFVGSGGGGDESDNGSSGAPVLELHARTWDGLYELAHSAGLALVFDLNALRSRQGPGPESAWNASDATRLLRHAAEKGQEMRGWQLGNEPDHWYAVRPPDQQVTPEALADDYRALRELVGENTLLQGPDACRSDNLTFLERFLAASPPLDAVTVHFYPLTGPHPHTGHEECTEQDFLDPAKLDRSNVGLQAYLDVVRANAPPGTPVVLGETATTGHGGCDGLSNAFASGFFFLDQLNRCARLGLQSVYRQDIAGWSGAPSPNSSYALLGDPGWTSGDEELLANPDYFLAVLWKRLVRGAVLASTLRASGDDGRLRVSAYCSHGGPGVVLAYVNMRAEAVEVVVQLCDEPWLFRPRGSRCGRAPLPREEYRLTAPSLRSRVVSLNSEPLARALPVPPLEPRRAAGDEPLVLDALSYGFVVLRAGDAPAATRHAFGTCVPEAWVQSQ